MLSREELLKQSAKSYMNSAQLEFFRALLSENKQTLISNLELVKHELGKLQHNNDELDRATVEEETMVRLRIIERESQLIRKIDEAVQRIDQGEYGYCAVTGEPIGIQRLLARPTATLCTEEKTRQETLERYYR